MSSCGSSNWIKATEESLPLMAGRINFLDRPPRLAPIRHALPIAAQPFEAVLAKLIPARFNCGQSILQTGVQAP